MKKNRIKFGLILAVTFSCVGCSSTMSSRSSGAVDDLYTTHNKVEIAKNEQAVNDYNQALSKSREQELDASMSRINRDLGLSALGTDTLTKGMSTESAQKYERLLRGFDSPVYEVPEEESQSNVDINFTFGVSAGWYYAPYMGYNPYYWGGSPYWNSSYYWGYPGWGHPYYRPYYRPYWGGSYYRPNTVYGSGYRGSSNYNSNGSGYRGSSSGSSYRGSSSGGSYRGSSSGSSSDKSYRGSSSTSSSGKSYRGSSSGSSIGSSIGSSSGSRFSGSSGGSSFRGSSGGSGFRGR